MRLVTRIVPLAAALLATTAMTAAAEETIKLGLSVPLSGAGANWGKGRC
jgi:branched-chain amino acid transport system substrate-binding protein